jgi:lysine biosynthesis protein LysW
MSIITVCPECDADIIFSTQPALGQCVICTDCQSAMTIIQLNPIVLDWAFLEPLESARIRPYPSLSNRLEKVKKRS